jgi:sulfotransferase family protein
MTPKKPTFLIVGAGKSGTTTLAHILDSHPDCCFSRPKEVYFFQDTFDNVVNPNYAKGWDWYQTAWSHYQGEPVVGEGSTGYSDRTNSPLTASKIHLFNPKMKIIYMVREPLARMISFWQMIHRDSYDTPPRSSKALRQHARKGFESFLTAPICRRTIWDQTRYHYQLEAYLKLFPREQILVSFLEDFKKDQHGEVNRILEFLGLDRSRVDNQVDVALNVGAKASRHSNLQRIIVRSFSRLLLRSLAGPKRWEQLAAKYARRAYPPAVPEITSATLEGFLAYVREDNQAFLKKWGKPSDYWRPAKVTLLDS